jgi:hypothetical protein
LSSILFKVTGSPYSHPQLPTTIIINIQWAITFILGKHKYIILVTKNKLLALPNYLEN